jgi:hypothetical protein
LLFSLNFFMDDPEAQGFFLPRAPDDHEDDHELFGAGALFAPSTSISLGTANFGDPALRKR